VASFVRLNVDILQNLQTDLETTDYWLGVLRSRTKQPEVGSSTQYELEQTAICALQERLESYRKLLEALL